MLLSNFITVGKNKYLLINKNSNSFFQTVTKLKIKQLFAKNLLHIRLLKLSEPLTSIFFYKRVIKQKSWSDKTLMGYGFK